MAMVRGIITTTIRATDSLPINPAGPDTSLLRDPWLVDQEGLHRNLTQFISRTCTKMAIQLVACRAYPHQATLPNHSSHPPLRI